MAKKYEICYNSDNAITMHTNEKEDFYIMRKRTDRRKRILVLLLCACFILESFYTTGLPAFATEIEENNQEPVSEKTATPAITPEAMGTAPPSSIPEAEDTVTPDTTPEAEGTATPGTTPEAESTATPDTTPEAMGGPGLSISPEPGESVSPSELPLPSESIFPSVSSSPSVSPTPSQSPEKKEASFMLARSGSDNEITVNGIACVKLENTMDITLSLTWMGTAGKDISLPALAAEDFILFADADEEGEKSLSYTSMVKESDSKYVLKGVPVYVTKDTGPESANPTYVTPSDFYQIKLEKDLPGFTVSPGTAKVSTSLDMNELQWTASASGITITLAELIDASFTLIWTDNRNHAGNRPYSSGEDYIGAAGKMAENIVLYYKEGEEYKEVTPKMLPFSEALKPEISKSSYSNWDCTFKNLPKQLLGSDAAYYIQIQWKDSETKDQYEMYRTEYDSGDYGKTVTNTYIPKLTGNVVWKDADLKENRPSAGSAITLNVYSRGTTPTPIGTGDYRLTWSHTETDIWSYEIAGLPAYNSDGDEIAYFTEMKVADGADYQYKITYDNGEESTDTDKCCDKGTIIATVTAKAEFSAKKEWKDANDTTAIDKRKQAIQTGITLYLWRYPSNKTIAAGAPVTKEGTQLSYRMQTEDGNRQEKSIGFAIFEAGNLPKYDEQGYRYHYYVTEVMAEGSGYRTAYDNRGASETDYHSITTAALHEGSIKNIPSEKVRIPVTKDWKAMGENDYQGAEVTLAFQTSSDGTLWKTESTQTLSGFGSMDLSKQVIFDEVEKYDDNGKPYQFRVIETQVKTAAAGGNETVIISSEKYQKSGDGYTADDVIINGHPYEIASTQKVDGSFGITNKLKGKQQITLIKVWKNWPTDKIQDITLTLYQNKKEYATVTITKGTGETPTASMQLKEGGSSSTALTVEKTEKSGEAGEETTVTWTLQSFEVPAYNEAGGRWNYSLAEDSLMVTAGSSYWTGYSYELTPAKEGEKAGMKAVVTNRFHTPGSEGSKYIKVEKVWQDDEDFSQREPVTLEVKKVKTDGTIEAVKNADGTSPNYQVTLSEENNWQGGIWIKPSLFADVDSWIVEETGIGTGAEERVVTYGKNKVDSGDSVRTGSVSEQKQTAGKLYKPGYQVEITGTGTGSLIGNTAYTVTNTRTGSMKVRVSKTWKDSFNALGYRKEGLRIKLCQNGSVMTTAPSGEEIYHDWKTEEQKAGEQYKETYEAYTFENLPIYDDKGKAYAYTAEEFILEGSTETHIDLTKTGDNTTTHYVAAREETTGYDTADGSYLREFRFTNTAAGKREEVLFYKVWRDEANFAKRPDIFYTLYYKKSGEPDESIAKYDGDYTVMWEAAGGNGNESAYYQKAVFRGLPAADAEGTVYEYFVTEDLNNNNIPYYSDYYNIDVIEGLVLLRTDNRKITGFSDKYHMETTEDAENAKESAAIAIHTSEGTLPLIGENGFIINTIKDTVVIKGKKIWKNLDAGITAKDLPDALIYLWRESPHDKANKDNNTAVTDPDKIDITKIIGEAKLSDAKTEYGFFEGETTAYEKFEKYDKYGAAYTYSVREQIMVNGAPLNVKAYTVPEFVMNNTGSEMTLTNYYHKDEPQNQRKITITKKWEKIPTDLAMGNYPVAKISLYRMEVMPEVDTEGTNPDNNPVEVPLPDGWPSAENMKLVETKETRYSGSAESTVRWDSLPIYAPSGKVYVYFVREETGGDFIPSYAVTNNAGEGAGTGGSDYQTNDNKKLTDTDIIISNTGIQAGKNTTTGGFNLKEAAYTNTYREDLVNQLTGTKKWVDGAFADEVRPQITGENCDNIKLTIWQNAATQSGSSNAMTGKEITEAEDFKIKIVWKQEAGASDVWNYTISFTDKDGNSIGLPIYAPNGKPYVYSVKETIINSSSGDNQAAENYQANPGEVSKTATAATAEAAGSVLAMGELKNTLKGNLKITKKWNDFYDKYGLREMNVEVVLQRKLESESDDKWKMVTNGEGTEYTATINKAGNWKAAFSNLPVVDDTGNVWKYRVLEKSIGNDTAFTDTMPSNPETVASGSTTTAGNYEVTHSEEVTLDSENTKSVQVSNKLSAMTSLKVSKQWEEDSENKYAVRPDSITVKLQYRIWKAEYAGAGTPNQTDGWTDLTKADGITVVTETLTKADGAAGAANRWEKTFENLPKTMKDPDGSDYLELQYRAVETDGGNSLESATDGAGKWQLLDSYAMTDSHSYEATGAGATAVTKSETTLTNTFVKRAPIRVTKVWNDEETSHREEVKAALFSPNFKTGEGTALAPLTQVANTEVTLNNTTAGYTWSDLPKYNTDQKEIIYYVKELSAAGSPVLTTAPDVIGNTADNRFHADYYKKAGETYVKASGTPHATEIKADTGETDIIILNTPLTSAKVEKIWADENNRYGIRPADIEVRLQRKRSSNAATDVTGNDIAETTGSTVGAATISETLKEENDWKAEMKNLPAYRIPETMAGNAYGREKIAYQLTEVNVPEGYQAAYVHNEEPAGSFTTKITNTLSAVSYRVEKKWAKDTDWRNRVRPEIELVLNASYENGSVTVPLDSLTDTEGKAVDKIIDFRLGTAGVTANTEGNLEYTWKNLPPYHEGKPITYTVEERAKAGGGYSLTGYTKAEETKLDSGAALLPKQAQISILFTNTLITVSAAVEKTWEDNNNKGGSRPNSMTLALMQKTPGSEKKIKDIILTPNAAGTWESYTEENLPKCDKAGNPYRYEYQEKTLHYSSGPVSIESPEVQYEVNHVHKEITPAGTGFKTEITNTWKFLDTGHLLVKKQLDVTNNSTAGNNFVGEFAFQVFLTTGGSENLYTGEYTVLEGSVKAENALTASGETKQTGTGGIIKIPKGKQFFIKNLPAGGAYRIREEQTAGFQTVTDVTGAVTKDNVASLEITNRIKAPMLTIDNTTKNPATGATDAGGSVGIRKPGNTDATKDADLVANEEEALKATWSAADNWYYGKELTVKYQEYGDNRVHIIKVTDFLNADGTVKPMEDAVYAALKGRFPNALLELDADKNPLLTLAADKDAMPCMVIVEVFFYQQALPVPAPEKPSSGNQEDKEKQPGPTPAPETFAAAPLPFAIVSPSPSIMILQEDDPRIIGFDQERGLPILSELPEGAYEVEEEEGIFYVYGPDGQVLGIRKRRGVNTGDSPALQIWLLLFLVGAGAAGTSWYQMKKGKRKKKR